MSVAKFSIGRSGAGGANAEYITREKAAEKIAFFNLEKLEADNKNEARTNTVAYAHTREESELARNKNGRTHYRLILSWDGKEESETAVEETKKFLKNNLPKGRAIIAVHQDTDHTHAHVWIDARQTDGKKIHLSKNKFKTLDESWAKQFDETYGTNYAAEYKAKKEETKRWKQTTREWKNIYAPLGDNAKNYPLPAKPERASDVFDTQYWRNKEIENLGAINQKYEEVGCGADQSTAQTRNRPFEGTERSALGTEPEFQTPDSVATGKSEASRNGNDFVLPASRNNSEERKDYGIDIDENQPQYVYGDGIYDVYDRRTERSAREFDRQKDSGEQFYGSGLRGYSENGRQVFGNAGENFGEIEGSKTATIELLNPPPISISKPQIKPNDEAFAKEIMEMMRQNLEEQNKRISPRAWKIYEDTLNSAGAMQPSQTHIEYVNKFNAEQENEDRKIHLEGKSKLEVIHEIASKADDEEKSEMLDKAAEALEQKVMQEKIQAMRQEMEFDHGMSM